jgi:hypothetical protein
MTKSDEHRPGLRVLLRWTIYLLVTLLVLAGVAALTVPSYLIKTLETQTLQQTGRKLTIDRLGFNLLTLSVDARGITLYEANQTDPAFSADELLLNISPASLLHFAPVVREVQLAHPRLQLMRAQQDGKEITNFTDVFDRLVQHPGKGDPVRFSVSNIQISNGAIELDDRIAGKKIHIESLQLNVPFISNFSTALDIFVEPYLSATINGSKLELKGRSKPFAETLDTNVAIDINQFNLTELVAFSPKPLPYKLKSAKLSTHLVLNFSAQKNNERISLSGTANLNEFALEDKNGAPLYTSKQINVNLQDANLVNQHITLNVLEVVDPQIWAGLDQRGVLNWLTPQSKTVEKNPPSAEPGKVSATLIDLTHVQIKNGTVHWSDAANAIPAMQMAITNIDVDAQHISTKDNAEPAKLTVSLGNDKHQQLRFEGTVSPQNAAVSGQLVLSEFALEDYQPYANRYIAAAVSGKLALQTHLDLQGGEVSLSEFSGGLEDLKIQANRREFGGLSAKKIALNNFSMNGATRQIKAEKLALDQVQGDLFRADDGTVNVIHIMKKSASAETARPAPGKPVPAWQAEINEVSLNDSQFTFGDKAVKPAVLLKADGVNIKLEHVSSNPARPVKLNMHATLNKTGKFAVDGTASEKAMQLNVDVQNFSVAALQPYFTQYLNITLEKGSVSTKGKLAWQNSGEIKYLGGVKLANFISSDKESNDDFLKWKLLEIAGINVDIGGKQPSVTLGKINLNEFYARAILSEQGKLNLQDIVVHPMPPYQPKEVLAAAPETRSAPAIVAKPEVAPPATIISVGEINLNDGVINYTDNFIKPHYSMRMTGMKGNVGAIHSDLPQSAPITINGKVDDEAPIAISGSMNPLFSPMLLDMKLTATGVDLPKLTTYALKYAGYPIVKGKLSLDVEYHIKDNQLSANNSLKIDQLTFGDKVDGPDATHLPVPFLISLLTDSNGQINLDLPISGTINDPQFSIGGLIVRVFVNIIEKVVTSPFSLLAHAFGGGGEEMAYIEFDPGSAKLTDAGKAKLDSLAKALAQRPQLKLDIIGRADMTADDAGLREHILSSQIKKSKNLEEEDDGGATVTEADRARAIEKIYSAAKFDKPRNFIGLAKSLPTAEMEKLIIANTKVTEDDIRALALRRESVVHAYLTDAAHVTPDKLFSIAPKLSGEGIKDKGAISRVDFELKM